MPASNIIQKSREYATRIILDELPKDFVYHDLDHTFSVLAHSMLLAFTNKLDDEQVEILQLAAFFHDLGYLKAYQGHELFSGQLAQEFLNQEKYPEEKITRVVACIHATIVEQAPTSLSEEIIKDADLASLGSADFMVFSSKLRYEWAFFCNEIYTDREWYQINHDFLSKHTYFTDEANRVYGPGKKFNLKRLKKLLKKAE